MTNERGAYLKTSTNHIVNSKKVNKKALVRAFLLTLTTVSLDSLDLDLGVVLAVTNLAITVTLGLEAND